MKGRKICGVNLVAETIKFCAISLLPVLFICVCDISFDIRSKWFSEQSFILLFLFKRASKSIRVLELVVGNISVNVSFSYAFHYISLICIKPSIKTCVTLLLIGNHKIVRVRTQRC